MPSLSANQLSVILPCSDNKDYQSENDVFFRWVTQAYSEKEKPISPNRSRTYDLPITSSDALPLSYKRLVEAKSFMGQTSCILLGLECQ